LLFDLLTTEEEQIDSETAELCFDIPVLTERRVAVTQWILRPFGQRDSAIGYFGASTGAAAARDRCGGLARFPLHRFTIQSTGTRSYLD
jgi:hypothetical protein